MSRTTYFPVHSCVTFGRFGDENGPQEFSGRAACNDRPMGRVRSFAGHPSKAPCNKPRFDAMIVRVHVPRAQGRDFSHKLIQKPMADKPYAASVDSPEGGQQWMLIGSLTRRGERACVGFLFRCYSDPVTKR